MINVHLVATQWHIHPPYAEDPPVLLHFKEIISKGMGLPLASVAASGANRSVQHRNLRECNKGVIYVCA